MTAKQIATEMDRDESTIRRWIKEARDSGMVHIVVTPPSSHEELMDLQLAVESRFNLKNAVIVPGSPDVMEVANSAEKEAILLLCCRAAANYLERTVQDGMILAVPCGRVGSYIAEFLNPDRDLPNLQVLPLVGLMGSRINRPSNTTRYLSTAGVAWVKPTCCKASPIASVKPSPNWYALTYPARTLPTNSSIPSRATIAKDFNVAIATSTC